MKYKTNSKKVKTNGKKLIIFFALLAVAIGAAYTLLWYRSKSDEAPAVDSAKEIVIDSSQEDGQDKEPVASPSRDAGAVDTSGQDVSESNQKVSSASGKITVYSPSPNSLVSNGDFLSGASSHSSVSYRLIDDDIGVLGSGSLNVVNGKFSGKFSFSSNGEKGRLDVFQTLEDGREVDVVEIEVRYK